MALDRPDHVATDYLVDNLRDRSIRGGTAIGISQGAQFVLGLASTAILARLLTPDDFGIVAMAGTLTGLLVLFLDLGLTTATVQRADLSGSQVSALFWINAATGVALGGLTIATAPAVAWFYGRPELVPVTMALGLSLIFAGASAQHSALLQRHMRFANLAALDVVAFALAIMAAVAAAWLGAGYWALVVLQLVQQASTMAGVWLLSRWRPSRPSTAGVRHLLSFGLALTGFNTLTYLSRTLDNVIIGRSVGSTALGLYLKAYSLLLLPASRIRGPVASVLIPALSRLQADRERFKTYYLNAMSAVTSIGMPVVVFLIVSVNAVVALMLGDGWQGSVVIFRALGPAAFVETFNAVGSWACTPLGQAGRLVRWQVVVTAVMVPAFLVGVHWGALGVAVAFSTCSVVLRVLGVLYLLNGTPIRPKDLFSVLARPALASIGAGVAFVALRSSVPIAIGDFTAILAGAPVFAAFYVAALLAVPGGRRSLGNARRLIESLVADRMKRADRTSPDRAER